MRRVVLLNLGVAMILAMLIALSAGRAPQAADKRLSENSSAGPTAAVGAAPRANTDDLRIAGAATWFAYSDAADRIDDLADDLEAIHRGESAAVLRAVVLQLRQDMQKLEAETRLNSAEQPMIFGGVSLNR